jgi:hypothetical protein
MTSVHVARRRVDSPQGDRQRKKSLTLVNRIPSVTGGVDRE